MRMVARPSSLLLPLIGRLECFPQATGAVECLAVITHRCPHRHDSVPQFHFLLTYSSLYGVLGRDLRAHYKQPHVCLLRPIPLSPPYPPPALGGTPNPWRRIRMNAVHGTVSFGAWPIPVSAFSILGCAHSHRDPVDFGIGHAKSNVHSCREDPPLGSAGH